MTAKNSVQTSHVEPGIDASSELPDSQLWLDGLMQQEQVLKKQVSRNKHTCYTLMQHRTHGMKCHSDEEGHKVML